MAVIISWNVNGIRAVIGKGFFDWLRKADADIVCLQETKIHPDQLTPEMKTPPGYKTYWANAQKRGYSGLACFTKSEPKSVGKLGVKEYDDEGRVQVLEYADFTLINAYFPNSQEEGKRLHYKLGFCDAILKLCNSLRKKGRHIVLCGDYNIAHTPVDLARPKENEESPGYLPEERAWMDKFIDAGYVDTFRMFEKGGGHYSWWSYRANARVNNVGWRIDLHCVNPEFRDSVKRAEILDQVTGSDHCPVLVEIK